MWEKVGKCHGHLSPEEGNICTLFKVNIIKVPWKRGSKSIKNQKFKMG